MACGWPGRTRNVSGDGDALTARCDDDLRLYGVGPSGRVSRVAVSVAELQACDVEPLPPFARWDRAIDAALVGVDELQLTRVAGTSTLVGTHTLRFP
ncbi:MAG: hypothetical protein K8W52_16160 [Deltaproteobacteria bacterium]|nr:hypothetical protein [Deltaproteobacteria bacterium]